MSATQSVQCFGKKKTATAVAHCKQGKGLIKVNGKPLSLVEPQILRFKVYEPVLILGLDKFGRFLGSVCVSEWGGRGGMGGAELTQCEHKSVMRLESGFWRIETGVEEFGSCADSIDCSGRRHPSASTRRWPHLPDLRNPPGHREEHRESHHARSSYHATPSPIPPLHYAFLLHARKANHQSTDNSV